MSADLTLTIISAKDLKSTALLTTSSTVQAYCNIQFGSNYKWDSKIYKTKAASKTSNPTWGQTFSVSLKNPTQAQVKILVKDKLAVMDKFIGEALFPLGEQALQKGQENIITLPIKKGGSQRGTLTISIIPHTFGTAQNTVTVIQQQPQIHQTIVQQPQTVVHQQTIAPPPQSTYGTIAPPPQPNPYGTVAPPPQPNPYDPNPYGTIAPPPQSNPYDPYGTTVPPPQPNPNPYGTTVPPPTY